MNASLPNPSLTGPELPTPESVVLLQTSGGYPCVSILMTTRPSDRMLTDDAHRLRGLVTQALSRLKAENLLASEPTVATVIETLLETARTGPTADAIGIYVSPSVHEIVRLPIPVVDRVVIDPTFATRDLMRALHRAPRHVVLVLDSSQARLFDARAGVLRPAVHTLFPLTRIETGSRGQRREREQRLRAREADLRRFYRRVDDALGAYLRLHPAPLAIAGPQRLVAQFQTRSAHTARLAGTIDGNFTTAPLTTIADRVEPVLMSYLRSREQEALTLLERRTSARRTASGIHDAWLAARTKRPEMLVVEEGYFYPARIGEDGDSLAPAEDIEHPEVIDDVVDELIEVVLERGGWVALTSDGALSDHHRVALTLRS
jgi:Bacterial archaeo-eukaryotic release factor family 3